MADHHLAPGFTLLDYARERGNAGHRWPCDWFERNACTCGFHDAANYALHLLFGGKMAHA